MSHRSRAASIMAVLALSLVAAGCTGGDEPEGSEPEGSGSSASASPETSDATGALIQTGLDQLAGGDAAAAAVTFQNVLTIDPENVFAHYNLGVIAQQSGDDAVAMASYDSVLEIDDAFAPALFNKAILTEVTDLQAAVDLYRRAVAADPEMAAAYMRLGFALVHLGEKDDGAVNLAKGIELDPSMADVEAPSYE